MPSFWQFRPLNGPGPACAIYQARFMRYLEHRGLLRTEGVRSGLLWATAKWTSPRRWQAFRSRS